MNLHKVKGLEAPIVFLADPTGKKEHEVSLHVDRSGPTVQGFLPIYGKLGAKRVLLAQPENWDSLAEREKQFQRAEQLRLLYVAATRAGTQLTISQRESGKGSNPWAFFEPSLAEFPECSDPGQQLPADEAAQLMAEEEVSHAISEIESKWAKVSRKTYEVVSVKATTVKRGKFTYSQGEHGAEWGSVIHLLLEAAMMRPDAEIESLAAAALSEQGLDSNLATEALETVRSVIQSKIWERALAAEQRLVEVPFQRLIKRDGDSEAVDTVLRGIIDLAFREPQGWVIVDYKSDRVSAGRVHELVELYSPQVASYADSWAEITGEPVHEVGLYFTHISEYVPVTLR
jgi:ATP-dependent helicase/nuclease subunit A